MCLPKFIVIMYVWVKYFMPLYQYFGLYTLQCVTSDVCKICEANLFKKKCFTVTFTGYRYGTAAIFRAIDITDILQNDSSCLLYEIKQVYRKFKLIGLNRQISKHWGKIPVKYLIIKA